MFSAGSIVAESRVSKTHCVIKSRSAKLRCVNKTEKSHIALGKKVSHQTGARKASSDIYVQSTHVPITKKLIEQALKVKTLTDNLNNVSVNDEEQAKIGQSVNDEKENGCCDRLAEEYTCVESKAVDTNIGNGEGTTVTDKCDFHAETIEAINHGEKVTVADNCIEMYADGDDSIQDVNDSNSTTQHVWFVYDDFPNMAINLFDDLLRKRKMETDEVDEILITGRQCSKYSTRQLSLTIRGDQEELLVLPSRIRRKRVKDITELPRELLNNTIAKKLRTAEKYKVETGPMRQWKTLMQVNNNGCTSRTLVHAVTDTERSHEPGIGNSWFRVSKSFVHC